MEIMRPCPFSGLLPGRFLLQRNYTFYFLGSEVTCVCHVVPAIVSVQVPVADLVIVPGHHSEDILMLMMMLIPGLDDEPPLVILLLDDGC